MHSCSRCDIKICDTHHRKLSAINYCENCFWEVFLFSNGKPQTDHDHWYEDVIVMPSASENSNTDDEGFSGGFGEGSFGGGGAGGGWNTSDAESFTNTDHSNPEFIDDETFFYS